LRRKKQRLFCTNLKLNLFNLDLPAVVDRRDSGFDSNDSGMDSPPQEEMQVESPKRVQRVISSDSAFGDETME
jgi:hypothetical protein